MSPSTADPSGSYLDWGVLHISVTNLVIIAVMVLVFVLAVLLPFPGGERHPVRKDGRR